MWKSRQPPTAAGTPALTPLSAMIFQETPLTGAFVIDLEAKQDERGFFARVWCEEELAAHGLNPQIAQASISYNRCRGTLRGLHYRVAPHAEAKMVRCVRGAMYDVIVDLRPSSANHLRWFVHADVGQPQIRLHP